MSYPAVVFAQAANEGTLLLSGVLALLAGILILIVPRILNYVVAAYLIVTGILLILAGL